MLEKTIYIVVGLVHYDISWLYIKQKLWYLVVFILLFSLNYSMLWTLMTSRTRKYYKWFIITYWYVCFSLDYSSPLCQASQLVVGQKQFRGSLSGNNGRLDGWNEDLALQGGLLWGQLQLLWHTGQNLHRVRQQHTETHTLGFFAYSCQQCLQGPSIRGKAQEFEETLGEEQAHTFSCSH